MDKNLFPIFWYLFLVIQLLALASGAKHKKMKVWTSWRQINPSLKILARGVVHDYDSKIMVLQLIESSFTR